MFRGTFLKVCKTNQLTNQMPSSVRRNGPSAKRQKYAPKKKFSKRRTLSRTVVPRGLAFPPQLRNRMKYCEIVPVAMVPGNYGSYLFRTNGLYDPNYTGTGHQPRYFDKLGTIYTYYTVVKSKCTVKIHDYNSAMGGFTYGLFVDEDGASGGGVTNQWDVFEQDGTVWDTTGFAMTKAPRTLSKTWSAAQQWGPNVVNNANFRGSFNTDPAETCYFVFGLAGTYGAGNIVFVSVEIDYEVEWNDLKTEPVS